MGFESALVGSVWGSIPGAARVVGGPGSGQAAPRAGPRRQRSGDDGALELQ